MSKQIYIDSNGNEIQVSGTVNSADMMPMSAGDSTKVSEAIDRRLSMSSSVNRGTIQISGSNNRMVITIYADTNNGMRMDFRGDNNVIRLATTTDGGTTWTNTNEIAFTHT